MFDNLFQSFQSPGAEDWKDIRVKLIVSICSSHEPLYCGLCSKGSSRRVDRPEVSRRLLRLFPVEAFF